MKIKWQMNIIIAILVTLGFFVLEDHSYSNMLPHFIGSILTCVAFDIVLGLLRKDKR